MKALHWLTYAIEYLPEVTWPGVGRFVRASVSARLDHDGNIISPPTYSLTLQHGDAGVTDWKDLLIHAGKLEAAHADEQFRTETEVLSLAIAEQPVPLARFGVLQRSIENRIIFQPSASIPASNYRESYGLQSLPFTLGFSPEGIQPELVESVAPVVNPEIPRSKIEVVDLRPDRPRRRWWPLMVAVLALAGCVFLFWKYRSQFSIPGPNKNVPDTQVDVTPPGPDPVVQLTPKSDEVTPPPKDTIAPVKMDPLPKTQKENTIIVKGAGLTRGVHHIIVYESTSYEKALAKLEELRKQYPMAQMSDGSNGRYMISVFHDADQLKTAKEMARLKDVFKSSYRLSL